MRASTLLPFIALALVAVAHAQRRISRPDAEDPSTPPKAPTSRGRARFSKTPEFERVVDDYEKASRDVHRKPVQRKTARDRSYEVSETYDDVPDSRRYTRPRVIHEDKFEAVNAPSTTKLFEPALSTERELQQSTEKAAQRLEDQGIKLDKPVRVELPQVLETTVRESEPSSTEVEGASTEAERELKKESASSTTTPSTTTERRSNSRSRTRTTTTEATKVRTRVRTRKPETPELLEATSTRPFRVGRRRLPGDQESLKGRGPSVLESGEEQPAPRTRNGRTTTSNTTRRTDSTRRTEAVRRGRGRRPEVVATTEPPRSPRRKAPIREDPTSTAQPTTTRSTLGRSRSRFSPTAAESSPSEVESKPRAIPRSRGRSRTQVVDELVASSTVDNPIRSLPEASTSRTIVTPKQVVRESVQSEVREVVSTRKVTRRKKVEATTRKKVEEVDDDLDELNYPPQFKAMILAKAKQGRPKKPNESENELIPRSTRPSRRRFSVSTKPPSRKPTITKKPWSATPDSIYDVLQPTRKPLALLRSTHKPEVVSIVTLVTRKPSAPPRSTDATPNVAPTPARPAVFHARFRESESTTPKKAVSSKPSRVAYPGRKNLKGAKVDERKAGRGGKTFDTFVTPAHAQQVAAAPNKVNRYSSRYRSELRAQTPSRASTYTPVYVPTVPTVTPSSQVKPQVYTEENDGYQIISIDDPVNSLHSDNLVSDAQTGDQSKSTVSIIERIINSITSISTTPKPENGTQSTESTAILKIARSTTEASRVSDDSTSEKPTTIIERILNSLSAIQATDHVGTTTHTPSTSTKKYEESRLYVSAYTARPDDNEVLSRVYSTQPVRKTTPASTVAISLAEYLASLGHTRSTTDGTTVEVSNEILAEATSFPSESLVTTIQPPFPLLSRILGLNVFGNAPPSTTSAYLNEGTTTIPPTPPTDVSVTTADLPASTGYPNTATTFNPTDLAMLGTTDRSSATNADLPTSTSDPTITTFSNDLKSADITFLGSIDRESATTNEDLSAKISGPTGRNTPQSVLEITDLSPPTTNAELHSGTTSRTDTTTPNDLSPIDNSILETTDRSSATTNGDLPSGATFPIDTTTSNDLSPVNNFILKTTDRSPATTNADLPSGTTFPTATSDSNDLIPIDNTMLRTTDRSPATTNADPTTITTTAPTPITTTLTPTTPTDTNAATTTEPPATTPQAFHVSLASVKITSPNEANQSVDDEDRSALPITTKRPPPSTKTPNRTAKLLLPNDDGPTTPRSRDYFIFAVLPNNTVVRKRPPKAVEAPYLIYGVYPNNTIVQKFPNGTLVPEEPVVQVSGFDTRDPLPPPTVITNRVTGERGMDDARDAKNVVDIDVNQLSLDLDDDAKTTQPRETTTTTPTSSKPSSMPTTTSTMPTSSMPTTTSTMQSSTMPTTTSTIPTSSMPTTTTSIPTTMPVTTVPTTIVPSTTDDDDLNSLTELLGGKTAEEFKNIVNQSGDSNATVEQLRNKEDDKNNEIGGGAGSTTVTSTAPPTTTTAMPTTTQRATTTTTKPTTTAPTTTAPKTTAPTTTRQIPTSTLYTTTDIGSFLASFLSTLRPVYTPTTTERPLVGVATTYAPVRAKPTTVFTNYIDDTTTHPPTVAITARRRTTTVPTTTTTLPTTTTTIPTTTRRRTTTTNPPTTTTQRATTTFNPAEVDIDELVKRSNKKLSKEQLREIEEIKKLEREQAALLEQLAFLTNLNIGQTTTQPPKVSNGDSNSLANRILAFAMERKKDASSPTTEQGITIVHADPVTTEKPSRNVVLDDKGTTLDDIIKELNDNRGNGVSETKKGKSQEAILAAILKERGIEPSTPKALKNVFDPPTTRKPRTTTQRPPGRLMQGLNWILNALAPPPTKPRPRPRPKPTTTKRPVTVTDFEELIHEPTELQSTFQSTRSAKQSSLSEDEVQNLIAQLEAIQRDPSKVRNLDLGPIKKLQSTTPKSRRRPDPEVEIISTGTTGSNKVTRAPLPRDEEAVPTNRARQTTPNYDDFEEVTTRARPTRGRVTLPPVRLDPVPGVNDEGSVIGGSFLSAAVNVTRAISTFLGSAIQVAARQVSSMIASGSGRLGSTASASSSFPSS